MNNLLLSVITSAVLLCAGFFMTLKKSKKEGRRFNKDGFMAWLIIAILAGVALYNFMGYLDRAG